MRLALGIVLLALAAALAGCGAGTSKPNCGACPAGATCGTANGLPVCRAASGVPLFSHVFVILMENTSLATLQKSQRAPYLQGLMAEKATATDYHGVAHPSLPNYLALTSGGTQGVSCDCQPTGTACASCDTDCACPVAATHLGAQLDAAGLDWRAYAEDMGTPCNSTAAGHYAPRHVPFLYYPDVANDPARCRDRVVDHSQLATDLGASPRAFSFIAPNLIHDMHDFTGGPDGQIANGDAWLAQLVPAITSSAAYQSGGLLIIAWDEDDYSGILNADDAVPLIALSPYAKTKYAGTARADHYSLLATIEDGLHLPRLGAAAQATPLGDLFPPH